MTSGVGAAWGAAGTDDHAPLRTSMKAEQQFAEAADGTERLGKRFGYLRSRCRFQTERHTRLTVRQPFAARKCRRYRFHLIFHIPPPGLINTLEGFADTRRWFRGYGPGVLRAE